MSATFAPASELADLFGDVVLAPASGADPFGASAGADAPAVSDTVFRASALARLRSTDVANDVCAAGLDVPANATPAIVDAWTVAYEPDVEEVADLDAQAAARADWWRAVASAPDTERLRAASVLRGEVARVGATALARAWFEFEREREREQQRQGGDHGVDDEASAGERAARVARSARRAAEQAAEQAETAAAAADVLGAGGVLAGDQLRAAIRSALRSPLLRAIAAAAGRAERALRSSRSAIVRRADGRGGVEQVGPEGIGRLIPHEAAALCGLLGAPQRLLALGRLCDRRALAWAPDRRRERARRGPLVVAVDESGSMAGDRIVAAKGLALALAGLAARDGRVVLLVGWGTANECRPHWVRPGRPDPAGLAQWAESMFSGGTDCHVPLRAVPDLIDSAPELRGAADVVIVTDGQLGVPDYVADYWRGWRARWQARALVIGVGVSDAGAIARVCDRAVYVPRADDAAAIEVAAATLEP